MSWWTRDRVFVGHPLRLYGTTDRWGRPTRFLDPPMAGWVDRATWMKVDAFQGFEPSPGAEEMARKRFMKPMMDEITAVVATNPSYSALWQLTLDLGGGEYGRVSTLFMCSRADRLVRYRWFQRFVHRPVLRAWCRIWNTKLVARLFPMDYSDEHED